MFFGVGVSCRILYSSVGYLYVSCSGSITSVGEERAILSAIVCLFIYLFIYTIFQEGYIFSSLTSLPYGPLDI